MALGSAKIFCICMIILGILGILVGSAAPFWLTTWSGETALGLWYFCTNDLCDRYYWELFNFEDYSIWFYGLHGGAGLATLLAILLFFVFLCKVCGKSDSAFGVGIVTLLCGLLAIGAGVVFFTKTLHSMALVTSGSRDWAFYVFSGGAVVITLFSIILLILPDPQNNAIHPY